AELVVGGALVAVGQYFVGFVGLLELGLGLRVAGITVRVMLHGDAPIGFFQFLLGSAPLHTQYFVIVPFLHADPTSGKPARASPAGFQRLSPTAVRWRWLVLFIYRLLLLRTRHRRH